jgi:hypothetical protein
MKRLRTAVAWVLGATMAGFFVYGMFRFPDNPIHPCSEHGYCGKQGRPHTEQDYQAFSQSNDLLSYWPAGIVALIVLQGRIPLNRRKNGTPT